MFGLPRQHLNLTLNKAQFDLWRLSDDEYHLLYEHSLSIKDTTHFGTRLGMYELYEKDHLTLPKAFLTLEHLFGPTSERFNFRSGSFSFPLLLNLLKSQGNFFYILHVFDSKGGLCLKLHRVLTDGKFRSDFDYSQPPCESEFSSSEIDQFLINFYSYLLKISKRICQLPRLPFLNQIDSNNIIYGYQDGQLFEQYFESDEDYIQAMQDFDSAHGEIKVQQTAEKIHSLLAFITA